MSAWPALPESLALPTLSARLEAAHGWEAKNRLLVQLARELPAMADDLKTDAHRVAGCEAQVWLVTQWQDGHLQLQADSDSRIVKGLLTLVCAAYAGRSQDEVAGFDFAALLQTLGLQRFLSSSRASGLAAMVKVIRAA
ncbi:SufE family protein [Silvimonas iriomotensis]|uniref:Cysteine desulfurase, sulfur acceptor subunit CsdE n=1 Tax=Silvimonas iriomotensis TaxID=449662 RepID=A0ABQ2P6D9_9NEIS|nr:SufE family protein [Silvimonas iriomotensis]GGP19277.1 cysteine desulfurase, sulfur acceptor subunit CsdE [Silvimonas iriomotensis]